ncbi:hypothetical protein PVAP13_4KG118200 [Panicum virgatum]|uniref:C2H2-type domain-containing protein n=1 Tax=Panicum virgatum TaxID=38727 RepID=A0A8T0TJG9_PANVG|nr:hypothetical protein PVAP13_4KG118200 [Panicum virgatum]
MSARDGCSGKRLLVVPAGSTAAASPTGHSSGPSGTPHLQPAAGARCPPLVPKRASFPCTACGKTFPTQQAMGGHCSAHARTRLAAGQLLPVPAGWVVEPAAGAGGGFGHHGLPLLQGSSSSATIHRLAVAAAPYPSFLPFIHPLSSQVTRGRPCCLDLQGPTMAMWPAVPQIQAAPVPAAQLCWGMAAPFHPCTFMPPLPCNATVGVAPGLRAAACGTSANQPGGGGGGVRADLTTLQLGSGGGHGARKRTLLPLFEHGRRQRRRAAAVMDGGDEGGLQEGQDMDGLDLELGL